MQTVLVTNIVWTIDKHELAKYGSYRNAADALGLPDSFSFDVEDGYDIDEAIRVSAQENYEKAEIDTYDYETIGDDDDFDEDDEDDDEI